MKKIFALFMGISLLFSVANAKQQRPVKHAHNGKSHSHVLPNNGRGKHNHRGNHNTKGTFYNKSVAHMHNERRHSHVLPNGRKIHRHGTAAANRKMNTPPSKQTTLQTTNTNKIKLYKYLKEEKPRFIDRSAVTLVRDQNNCIHWASAGVKSYHWTGGCRRGFAFGRGALVIYYKDKKKQRKKMFAIRRTERSLYEKAGNIDEGNQRRIRKAEKEKEDLIRKKKQLIIDKDLIKFAKKYNFNSLIKGATDVNASWSPDEKSLAGVNGNGKISLYLNRSHEATAYITGKFKNGRLIGSAKLKVYASKCYKKGWIFCKVSEDDTSTRSVTSSSNIKKYVNNAIDKMLPGMYSRASRTISRLRTSSSSYSSSSYSNPATTSSSSSQSTARKAGVIKTTERSPWTIIKCSKGNDIKIHHNSDGSCTDNYSFGSLPCQYMMKKSIKRCENR